jgi:single-stranded-DNA-specific exonuclease
MISELQLLAPYGMKNPAPRFMLNGLLLKEMKIMGKDQQHIKLLLNHPLDANSMTMEAIAFGKSYWAPFISSNDQIDIMGELSVNEWNGIRRPQIMIKDIRIVETQIFDWRGKKPGDPAVIKWIEHFNSNMKDAGKKAIVLFREEEWAGLDSKVINEQGIAVWLDQEIGILKPMNHIAKHTTLEEIGDLLIYSLPPNILCIQRILPVFSLANRVYCMLQDRLANLSGPMPTREQFIQVYRLLIRNRMIDIGILETEVKKRTELTSSSLLFILTVFEELLFLAIDGVQVHMQVTPAKMELHESRSYQEKLHREEIESVLIYSNAKELREWILQHMIVTESARLNVK